MRRTKLALVSGILVIMAALPGIGVANNGAEVPAGSSQSSTATELARRDVTSTPTGKKIAQESAKRFREKYGVATDSSDLRVYDMNGDGTDLVVAPKDAEFSVEIQPGDNGKSHFALSVTTPSKRKSSPSMGDATVQAVTIQSAGSWTQVAGECFARYTEPNWGSWIDSCYKLNKFSDTVLSGDKLKDVYALHHYATAGNGNGDLDWANIWNLPRTPGLTWADWQPKSDTTGNCRTENLSVSVNGVGISHPMTACETWDITKSTTAGMFANKWSSPGGIYGNREVGYAVEVYIDTGSAWPVWTMYWDVY